MLMHDRHQWTYSYICTDRQSMHLIRARQKIHSFVDGVVIYPMHSESNYLLTLRPLADLAVNKDGAN